MDTLLGPILVGLVSFLGVRIQLSANEKNISKQVKEELGANIELQEHKHTIDKLRAKWELQFESFRELIELLRTSSAIDTRARAVNFVDLLSRVMFLAPFIYEDLKIAIGLRKVSGIVGDFISEEGSDEKFTEISSAINHEFSNTIANIALSMGFFQHQKINFNEEPYKSYFDSISK